MKSSLISLFLMMALSACAPPKNYYIRNISSNNIDITLLSILSSKLYNNKKIEFGYIEKIIKPKFNSYEKFNKSIVVRPNKHDFTFTIPAKCTLYITFSSGSQIAFFDKAIINNGSSIDTLNFVRDNKNTLHKISNRFSSGRAVWYDIK